MVQSVFLLCLDYCLLCISFISVLRHNPNRVYALSHQTEVMLMIEVAELIVAFIGALATVIGVVHTIRRDKRNDHKKENSRPGLDN